MLTLTPYSELIAEPAIIVEQEPGGIKVVVKGPTAVLGSVIMEMLIYSFNPFICLQRPPSTQRQ